MGKLAIEYLSKTRGLGGEGGLGSGSNMGPMDTEALTHTVHMGFRLDAREDSELPSSTMCINI